MSRAPSIHDKIAVVERAVKERFGSKGYVRRIANGGWEVGIMRGFCDYESKGRHRSSPFAACKQAGVSVEATV